MASSQYTGWVLDVVPEPLGSALAGALTYDQVVAGISVLPVGDALDFDEAGGMLDLAGTRLAYVAVDYDADTVTLAAPLDPALAAQPSESTDPDTGEPISDPGGLEDGTTLTCWDVENDAPVTQLVCYVRLGGEGADDDPVPCTVAHALVPLLPVGIRDGVGETVLVENSSGRWRVVDVQGKQAVLDGTVIDPSTMPPPGDSEPTEPPASSPAVEVHGTADSLVVEVTEEFAATSTLEFHLSLEPDFTPGPTTLAGTSPTAVYVVVIPPPAAIPAEEPAPDTGAPAPAEEPPTGAAAAEDTDGPTDPSDPARLRLGRTYYARVVARNNIGAAAAGPVASGELDPSTVTELVAARIVTGFTMTGAIQVGTHTWDPVNGLVIPQNNGGTIHLPADGTIANIDAHVTARSMNVLKDWAIGGYGELAGDMQIMEGISAPTSKPALTAVTLPLTVDKFYPGSTYAMAVDSSDDDGRAAAWLLTKFSSGAWGLWGRLLSLVNQNATEIEGRIFADSEAAKLGLTAGAYPYGIVFLSASRFLMTTKGQNGNDIEDRVHSISFPGMVVEHSLVLNRNQQIACFPVAASSLGACVVQTTKTASGYDLQVLRLNVAADGTLSSMGGWSNRQGLTDSAGPATAAVAFVDRESGKFRVGITRTKDGVLRVWDINLGTTPTLTRLTAHDAPMGTGAEGAILPGGLGGALRPVGSLPGVFALDVAGYIHAHTEIRGGSASNKVNAAYTWYDPDPTGGTHETDPSPTASITIPNGRWLRIGIPPAPEEEITDPARTDKADRARIYASLATDPVDLLGETRLGAHSVTADFRYFVRGNQPPPTENGFADAGADPARIRSSATDASQAPLIELSGNGKWRLGSLASGADGVLLNRIGKFWQSDTMPVAHASETVVPFSVAATEPGFASPSVFGAFNGSGNFVWTGPAGLYRFTAYVYYSPGTGSGPLGTRRIIGIFKNASSGEGSRFARNDNVSKAANNGSSNPGAATGVQCAGTVNMTPGDYVRVNAYQDSGQALNITWRWFEIERVA